MEVKFEVATLEQAYIKSGWYGRTGAGKTFTALSVATKIAPAEIVDGKKIPRTALIATERGMDFYSEYFDFSIFRTRYADEAKEAVWKAEDTGHKCLIIDQLTHIWESVQDEYIADEHEKMSKAWGHIERNGSIPFYGWKKIKKPYKDLIKALLNCNMHVFMIMRAKAEYDISDGGDTIKKLGEVIDAEKQTEYEPHILVKMEHNKKAKTWYAYIEKDHSRTIQGKVFTNPGSDMFDSIVAKLGKVQGQAIPEPEDVSTKSFEEEPVRASQAKIIRLLSQKGGIDKELVEEALSNMRAVDADRVVNAMTKGEFTVLAEFTQN